MVSLKEYTIKQIDQAFKNIRSNEVVHSTNRSVIKALNGDRIARFKWGAKSVDIMIFLNTPELEELENKNLVRFVERSAKKSKNKDGVQVTTSNQELINKLIQISAQISNRI